MVIIKVIDYHTEYLSAVGLFELKEEIEVTVARFLDIPQENVISNFVPRDLPNGVGLQSRLARPVIEVLFQVKWSNEQKTMAMTIVAKLLRQRCPVSMGEIRVIATTFDDDPKAGQYVKYPA